MRPLAAWPDAGPDGLPWPVLAAWGVLAAILVPVAVRGLAALARAAMSPAALPVGLRLLQPWARAIGGRLAFLPQPLLRSGRRLLERAALDGQLDAPSLVALCLLTGAAGAALSTMLFAAGLVPGGLWPAAALLGAAWPPWWLRGVARRRGEDMERQLAFLLDLLVLATEAGLGLASALGRVTDELPAGPLREAFERAMREIRAGRPRDEALSALAQRSGLRSLSQFAAALAGAARQGTGLGPLLRAQADQRRSERFQRAEKAALEAPVKLLAPLVICIFPGTFVVLMFPVAMRLLDQGMLR